MNLKINGKTYTAQNKKGRIIRQALEIYESVDFNSIKLKDLDALVDFAVEVYGNKFTSDDFYDGINADDLLITLINIITEAVGGFTSKVNQIPNEVAE